MAAKSAQDKLAQQIKDGRRGGKTTLERYGKYYFTELAEKRWHKKRNGK